MSGVTLVNFYHDRNFRRRIPLGLVSIKNQLENSGREVDFIDFQTQNLELDSPSLSNLVRENEYVLISAMSLTFPWLFPFIFNLKRKNPNQKIVLGGPGPSSAGPLILKLFPEVDLVVRGEGETAAKLITSGSKLNTIPNLVYRDGQEIIENPKEREDFARLEELDFSRLELKLYEDFSSIITTRGCPFNCTFCYNREMWGKRVQMQDTEKIFKSIDQIINTFGINHIKIVDDFFLASRERVKSFFREYRSRGYSFRYTIMGGRVDSLDEEILSGLRDTNCVSLWFGIESGSDRVLREIGKGFTSRIAERSLNLTRKYIPQVVASFIVGFPFETWEEFQQTLEFSRRAYTNGMDVFVNLLRPQNGTQIYEKYFSSLRFVDTELLISPKIPLSEDEKERIKSNTELYSWFHTYETARLYDKIMELQRLKEKQPLRTEERRRLLER